MQQGRASPRLELRCVSDKLLNRIKVSGRGITKKGKLHSEEEAGTELTKLMREEPDVLK